MVVGGYVLCSKVRHAQALVEAGLSICPDCSVELPEFNLFQLKIYRVERSISPSIFLIKQRGQPLCGGYLIHMCTESHFLR